jgi:hypothetical protein
LYADLDQDGSTSLAAIEKSNLVPVPSYVLNTSPDKYQVIWKVEDVQKAQAEPLLHALAREFDGDHAATDSARVLRLPGFTNKKYEQDFQVTAHSQTDATYRPRDFKLRTEAVDSDYRQPRGAARRAETSERRPISQSERDWAHVKSSLANGADPEALIAELARSRSADKSDPQYYARLTKQPKAGFHAFRRYRLTWLRKNRVHADLERFWMGHENETVGDGYSKMKEDVAFRLEQAAKVGLGFALPPKTTDVARIARKNEAKPEVENAA